MFLVWALALVGLFLIYMEFFLPGAIMAIGGSLLLLGSVCMFYLIKPNPLLLVLYLIVLAAAVYTLVRFAQWRIRSVGKKGLFVSSQQISIVPKEMVGRFAKASTDLKPSGQICIDNKDYQALSESGPIEKGADVVVIGEKGIHLLVQSQLNRDLLP